MATLSAAITNSVSRSPALAAAQTMEIIRKREEALSRILMAFVTTGLLFMVFPAHFWVSGICCKSAAKKAWHRSRPLGCKRTATHKSSVGLEVSF